MSAADAVLACHDLSVGHGRRVVARAIAFELAAGEVLCLLGPNGSGKTTLFKTLLGLLPACAGMVRLQGRGVHTWSRREFARVVGYVPQAHEDMFPLRVEDVVLMGRTARIGRFSGPSRHDREVARRCLESLGIEALADAACTEISGGERQLVLVARALAQEPAILVMDEPTANLDFGNQIRVLEHIGSLHRRGIAVLLSTHQPEHALRVADRIALLARGAIQAIGPAREIATAANLAQLYGVSEAAVRASLSVPASGTLP